MKKEIYLIVVIVGLLLLSTVSGGLFNFFKSPVTGKASSQGTSLSITVQALLPTLTIISPTSTAYSTNSILLNYTATNANTIWYSLDGASNITISSPTTLTIADGSHSLFLYANNSENNINWTNVSFSVDTPDGGVSTGGGGGGGGGSTTKKEETVVSEETPEEKTKTFSDSDYIFFEFRYSEGNIVLIDKDFEKGNFPTLSHDVEREFRINSYSKDGELLYSYSFDPGSLFSDENEIKGDKDGLIKFDNNIFYLAIPDEDVDNIKILRFGDIVFEESI